MRERAVKMCVILAIIRRLRYFLQSFYRRGRGKFFDSRYVLCKNTTGRFVNCGELMTRDGGVAKALEECDFKPCAQQKRLISSWSVKPFKDDIPGVWVWVTVGNRIIEDFSINISPKDVSQDMDRNDVL